jgi:hypothetical protein
VGGPTGNSFLKNIREVWYELVITQDVTGL